MTTRKDREESAIESKARLDAYYEKLNKLASEYGVSINEIDIELQRRKHARSIFGTVPLFENQYYLNAVVDKIEALDRKKEKK